MRSIFERFSDLNAFSLATADYAIAQGQAEAVARSVDGDRPTRIQSHVETRARACEKRGPQWRIITNLDELVELRSRIAMVRLAGTERIKLMYGPELSRLPEPAREQLLVALAVLISFESWDQMPLVRPFDGGRARRLAVCDRPDGAVGWIIGAHSTNWKTS